MLESIYVIKSNIYFTWFALLLFFTGFCFSYLVDLLNIRQLTVFPHWFFRVMSKFVNPKVSFIQNFLVIALFNSISIALYMLSGLFIIFPFIIAFMTGMNIGLSIFIPPQLNIEGYHIRMPNKPAQIMKTIIFSTMVLIIEVMIFSIALGMGMSLGTAAYSLEAGGLTGGLFLAELMMIRIKAYLILCVPILALSAYLETSVLKGR